MGGRRRRRRRPTCNAGRDHITPSDRAASNRVREGENMPRTAHLPASRVQALSLRVHGYVSWRFTTDEQEDSIIQQQ
jgi:hypothetical protein